MDFVENDVEHADKTCRQQNDRRNVRLHDIETSHQWKPAGCISKFMALRALSLPQAVASGTMQMPVESRDESPSVELPRILSAKRDEMAAMSKAVALSLMCGFNYRTCALDGMTGVYRRKPTNQLEALFEGAKTGNVKQVGKAMKKCDVNKQDDTGATALFVAAFCGFPEVVAELMTVADVNLARDSGATPIYAASQLGHADVVRLLMDRANVNQATNEGMTPLLIASANGHDDVVFFLLKRVDPNVPNRDGITPLYVASANGHTEVVRLLLTKARASIPGPDGMSALHVAAMRGHTDVVRFLLEKIDVNLTTPDGATALLLACANGQTKIVEILLENANVDLADKDGYTPLFVASLYGHVGVVKLLLAHSANANYVSNSGYTPLQIASMYGYHDVVRLLLKHSNVNFARQKDGATALHLAILRGHFRVVDALLLRADANQPTQFAGATPLGLACDVGHLEIMRLLIAKADVDMPTESGLSPLIVAVHKGLIEITDVLLTKAEVDLPSKTGATPLVTAAYHGHVQLVDMLLQAGADPNFTDPSGATPLFAASQRGHVDIVRLLLAIPDIQINAAMDDGATPLFIACQEGHKVVVELLLPRSEPNIATHNGATPLLIAVQNHHLDIIQRLAEVANVDCINQSGNGALYIAALKGYLDAMEILVERANLQSMSGATALYVAAEKGNVDMIRLLLSKDANVDVPLLTGTTPLYIASQCGHAAVVKLLLPTAIVNAEREDGATSLIIAAQLGHVHIVRLLIVHPKLNINHQMKDGDTALHVACEEGHTLVVRQLLRVPSISLDLANAAGKTALEIAKDLQHTSIVNLIDEFVNARTARSNSRPKSSLRPGNTMSTASSLDGLESSRSFFDTSNGSDFSDLATRSNQIDDDAIEMPELEIFRLDDTLVEMQKYIGSGIYCDMWRASYNEQPVAVKKLQPSNVTLQDLQRLVDEIKLLSQFDSKFVVKLIGASWTFPTDLKCVLELMDGGNLAQKLAGTTPASFGWSEKLLVLQQVVEGLCYVHSYHVVHRDLRSKSILLDSKKGVKLAGFSISCDEADATLLAGQAMTSRWMAPEVLNGKHYTSESDIYALGFSLQILNISESFMFVGVVMSEICSHLLPYSKQLHPDTKTPLTDATICAEVSKGTLKPIFTADCPEWFVDMGNQCLAFDPEDRPNAFQLSHILRHNFQPLSSESTPESPRPASPPSSNQVEEQMQSSRHVIVRQDTPTPAEGVNRLDEAQLLLTRRLGSGAFGEVWYGTYGAEQVAVKKLHPHMMTNRDQVEAFVAEIKLMSQFDSPCIVSVVGACWTTLSDIRFVMEYMDGGDLGDKLTNSTVETFPWPEKITILVSVIEALCDVHAEHIIHRDLKSRNILLDSKKGTKLTDFGISKEDDHSTMTEGMGTCRWMAPEVIEGKKYTVSADIYSFGMILSEMDRHEIPFKSEKNKSGGTLQNFQIMMGVVEGTLKPTFTDTCPDWIKDMALKCISRDPEARPTAYELSHILRKKRRLSITS
ncbi:hypothetical protein AeMF1_002863 [Aphanomyces euteiches]|nr:hypothetical protein AeMF1_002863 [Aphanomyces euteiches]